MKLFHKHIIIVFTLLFLSTFQNVFGQMYFLKLKSAETDLKIITDTAYFFMDRKDVISIMKQLEKIEKTNFKILIKKMKGVCFEAFNLNKIIDDKEISAIQTLMKNDFLFLAIQQKKVAIQYKKSNQFLNKVELVLATNKNTDSNTIINQIKDVTGAVIFAKIK